MPTVWIPASLRQLAQGEEKVVVTGNTVRQVIDEVDARFPGIKDRLCDKSGLRPGIAVAIDTQLATMGLLQTVGDDSEVHFLPAISGGC